MELCKSIIDDDMPFVNEAYQSLTDSDVTQLLSSLVYTCDYNVCMIYLHINCNYRIMMNQRW